MGVEEEVGTEDGVGDFAPTSVGVNVKVGVGWVGDGVRVGAGDGDAVAEPGGDMLVPTMSSVRFVRSGIAKVQEVSKMQHATVSAILRPACGPGS